MASLQTDMVFQHRDGNWEHYLPPAPRLQGLEWLVVAEYTRQARAGMWRFRHFRRDWYVRVYFVQGLPIFSPLARAVTVQSRILKNGVWNTAPSDETRLRFFFFYAHRMPNEATRSTYSSTHQTSEDMGHRRKNSSMSLRRAEQEFYAFSIIFHTVSYSSSATVHYMYCTVALGSSTVTCLYELLYVHTVQ
jgi:hypothetical protein